MIIIADTIYKDTNRRLSAKNIFNGKISGCLKGIPDIFNYSVYYITQTMEGLISSEKVIEPIKDIILNYKGDEDLTNLYSAMIITQIIEALTEKEEVILFCTKEFSDNNYELLKVMVDNLSKVHIVIDPEEYLMHTILGYYDELELQDEYISSLI
ncbi:MAG: hypothetical protein ACRC0R_03575 [Cetobacterium sp.]